MNIEYKKNPDMSVEEILQSIKEVINNRESQINDDILELTHIIDNKKVLEQAKQPRQNLSNSLGSQGAQRLQEPLISGNSAGETDSLQNYLTIAKDSKDSPTGFKSKNLEELIVEMLRPQLTRWLDKNLPSLVKQLVEQEIQRLMPNNQK